ncbi:MAG: maleylpyruvate isomerase family mycothiol-dependent enzyme [Mycobacteriales bacterium]
MSKDSWLAALTDQATQFRAAVTAGDPDQTLATPVPSCPGWSVADLVAHLGSVYERIAGCLQRAGAPPDRKNVPVAPSGTDVLEWWDERLRIVQQALGDAEPDNPAWHQFHKPQHAEFYQRRAAHETAVHRWDAQLSIGLPDPIDPPELAADGVAEVLDTFLPSDSSLTERISVTGVVRLTATDIDAHWVVRIRENGVTLLDTASWFDTEPDVAAATEATASDLLLALWGRIPVSVTDNKGEPALIELLRVRR